MAIDIERPASPTTHDAADPDALFREAKRHQRRRRLLIGTVLIAVVVTASSLVLALGPSGPIGFPDRSAETSATPFANTKAFTHHGLLAFVSKGALFVLDGSGGSLRRLTTTPFRGADPEFSPDGEWLAYVTYRPAPYMSPLSSPGGQLWIARSNGTDPRAILGIEASELSWSPRTDLLAVIGSSGHTSQAHTGITLVTPGGDARALAGTSHAADLVWSPDSREIAFAGDYRFGSLSVVAVSGTSAPTVWFQAPYEPAYPDAYNPTVPAAWLTGNRILFWIDSDDSADIKQEGLPLYLVPGPGAPAVALGTTLTTGRPIAVGPAGSFAFVNSGGEYAWQNKTLEVCNSVSATCTPVSTPSSEVSIDPSWSPSGALAYVEAPAVSDSSFPQSIVHRWYDAHTLWVAKPGTVQRTARAGGASVPVWSSDGKALLYESHDALWLLPTVGTQPIKVVSPLFTGDDWPTDFGNVDWSGQFAWRS